MRFACFNAHTCVESSEVGQRDPKFGGQTKCADGKCKKKQANFYLLQAVAFTFSSELSI